VPRIDIGSYEGSFVLRFGGEFSRINAYTLASTLVSVADAARAANGLINPGYDIEVVVEALGSGSFKAKIRAVYRQGGNLFSVQNLRAVVLSVIAAHIYTQTLAPGVSINVVTNEDSVVVTAGDQTVVVPRSTYEAMQEVQSLETFRQAVSRAFRSVDGDETIQSVAITSGDDTDEETPIEVSREQFAVLAGETATSDVPTREVEEQTEVQIMRAILEQSRRRWEFVWRGVTIAAPVLDSSFFEKFAAHEITIAPGDALVVRLRIVQRLDASGIYVNQKYEVVSVLEHIPRPSQASLGG